MMCFPSAIFQIRFVAAARPTRRANFFAYVTAETTYYSIIRRPKASPCTRVSAHTKQTTPKKRNYTHNNLH
jgi:hypothetical protein